LRLATIQRGGEEIVAVFVSGGVVPVDEIRDPDGDGWPVDLLSLLESGRLDELQSHVDGLGPMQNDSRRGRHRTGR
jgi:hypothetical protein